MVGSPVPHANDYLYSLADQEEYEEIIHHIRTHDDEHVRYGAAGVLAASVEEFTAKASPELRHALINAVLNDPSDMVRATVLKVLLDIDESILDSIITRLEVNPNSTPTERPFPLVLTKWQAADHPELRFLAVVGYGRVASHSTITKLRTAITKEQDMRVLRRAIEEGGKVGDETFVSPIQEHLRADNEDFKQASNTEAISRIKEAAVNALIRIGTAAAYEALVTATRSSDEVLKEHVISEIGRFGAQDTVGLIVDELDRNDKAIQREAADGIITTFTEADFEEGHSVREQAIEKIDEDVSHDVSEAFVSIVEESPYASEQRNAAWLLGQLETHPRLEANTDATVECLLDSLDTDDEYLRKIAAATLTAFEPSEIESRIDDVLATVDPESEAHQLASFIKSAMQDEAEEAKKNFVEYTYVASPSDYTSTY